MELEEVKKVYGLDPNEIGRDNRGWSIVDGMLVIMTKDTDKFKKMEGAESCFMRDKYKNFIWVSCDIFDKRILYYWYHRLDATNREVRELYESHSGDKRWR